MSGKPGPYDDIIHLPHHTSTTRPRMPQENRAAQFSPFAALTGYEAAIQETARQTDKRVELGDHDIAALDMKLFLLADQLADHPEITVTYFQPDEKKAGGAYVTAMGKLKKLDDYEKTLQLMDGRKISIPDILDMQSGLFEALL